MQLLLSAIQFIFDSGLFNWTPKKEAALLNSAKNILSFMCGVEATYFECIFDKADMK